MRWLHSANLSCQAVPALAIKPFIRCPPDATMVLRPEQQSMLVRMERPRTNADWTQLVDAHPAWGKRLETHLEPGVHTVTFRARSATSNAVDVCRTVITVKGKWPNQNFVTYLTGVCLDRIASASGHQLSEQHGSAASCR